MKIGIDARMYGPECTGIGNYIRNLIAQLTTIDTQNEYVIFLLPQHYDEFTPSRAGVHKAKVTSVWYTLDEQTRLTKELAQVPVDLMHFPHFNVPLRYKGPYVVTVHDLIQYYFTNGGPKAYLKKKAYQAVFSNAVRRARSVISVSQYTKEDLLRIAAVPESKIHVTYEGVDPMFRPGTPDEIADLRKRYNLPEKFIFYVGVWRDHKNIGGLLRALRHMQTQLGSSAKLVLGGKKDPRFPEVPELITQLGLDKEVIKPGFIPDEDLPLFYSAASVYVIPSFREGFGLPPLEAMACGTPVVSSNATCLPEVLGDGAVFVDPNDHTGMANAIHALMTDQKHRADVIARGKKHVAQFTWKATAEKTLEIYKEILRS